MAPAPQVSRPSSLSTFSPLQTDIAHLPAWGQLYIVPAPASEGLELLAQEMANETKATTVIRAVREGFRGGLGMVDFLREGWEVDHHWWCGGLQATLRPDTR